MSRRHERPEEKGETTSHETIRRDEAPVDNGDARRADPGLSHENPGPTHTHEDPAPHQDPLPVEWGSASAPPSGGWNGGSATPAPAPAPAPSNDSIGSCAGFYNALYCGQNFVHLGDPNTLYECRNGQFLVHERCASGCVATGTGVNDYCAP